MRQRLPIPKVSFQSVGIKFGTHVRARGRGYTRSEFAIATEASYLDGIKVLVGLENQVFDKVTADDEGKFLLDEVLGPASFDSPGVGVMIERIRPNPTFAIFCDSFDTAGANLSAIAMHLKALRDIVLWEECSPERYSRFEFPRKVVRNEVGRVVGCEPHFPEGRDDIVSLYLWISWLLCRSDRKLYLDVTDMCEGQGHRFIRRLLKTTDPGLACHSLEYQRVEILRERYWGQTA
jgi:hypothetical protein